MMAKTSPLERIRRAHADCDPMSATGQLLLDQYLARVDLGRPGPTMENETVLFYEACRLVEELDLSELSVTTFRAAIDRPGLSKTARMRRRRVTGRFFRILVEDGFPSARERRARERIEEVLKELGAEHAACVRDWVRKRLDENVGWYDLSHEIRRIAQLELIASASSDGCESDELIRKWLYKVVQQVVDCCCPPVTRYPDPTRCKSCGATRAEGSRPSPGPRKQDELAVVGRRYLDVRQAWSAFS
jgi:hypothetical protein